MHPRNRNIGRYDIPALVRRLPDLGAFVQPSKSGEDTIDFSQPEAVKLLNRALVLSDYGLDHWDFPEAHLCPPVPGRADYLHHMADLLSGATDGKVPEGKTVRVLDVGVGATAIYPIVGIVEYGWSFVGCDISEESLASSASILASTPSFKANWNAVTSPMQSGNLLASLHRPSGLPSPCATHLFTPVPKKPWRAPCARPATSKAARPGAPC